MAMFHLLKIRMSIDIFRNEKCKVIFGLEYTNTYCGDNEKVEAQLYLGLVGGHGYK